jgi:hypothetical protein
MQIVHSLVVLLALVAVVFACSGHRLSAPEDLCPQHIGPPCPRFFNNSYQDYQPGTPVVITPQMNSSMQQTLLQYVDLVLKNMPAKFNDSADDGFSVYVCMDLFV